MMSHEKWLALSYEEKKLDAEKTAEWLLGHLESRLSQRNETIEHFSVRSKTTQEDEKNKIEKILKKLYPLKMRLEHAIQNVKDNKSNPAWIQLNYYKIVGEFCLP